MERKDTRGCFHIGFAPRKRSKNARAGAGWNVGTMWPARRIVAKLKSCAGGVAEPVSKLSQAKHMTRERTWVAGRDGVRARRTLSGAPATVYVVT